MGDKSPQNQIKIGNITVKLNPNNQQKNSRDSNYEKNYHRGNDRNSGSNDRYKDRSNERERNRYQNDNNRYANKKNEYDNKRDKYNKKYKNNSRSPSKHRHSHHHSRSRSRDRDHSHHNNQNKYYNTNEQGNTNNNQNNNNLNNNNPQNNNNAQNVNMTNAVPNKNIQNNINNNMAFMNPMNQNYLNNYNEFIKQFYQMSGLKNNNVNNIIVPIGIPVNYFYNSNFNNMNQMNKNNNINNQNKNNNQTNNQNQKEEPSNTILITDLDTNITKETLEDIFRDKCLKLQISMPVDIRLVEALNIAYVIFPSITSCVIVYNSLLNQKILINGKYFPVQFSPNLTQKYSNNRDTLTYVTQISSNTSLTTSMETTVHEDWYCVYCDSKNFSRRTICFKCQKPKSINCRVVPVIKQKKIILGANGEILPNNSIIIQGKQIQYSNEGEVFIFF